MSKAKRIIRRGLGLILGRGVIISLRNSKILGQKYGQYQSAKEWSCINAEGLPIPWYTYPTIEYLNNLKLDGISVLEYGSGNSSLYYLRRGAKVVSIENDRDWYEKIKGENIDDSFDYVFANSDSEYIHRKEINSADVIVIDGSYRPECAEYVIQNILDGNSNPSMIIFDNSDWYPKTIKKLDDKIEWVRVDFCGFGPINGYTWVTSIYFNPEKKLSRI
ncbi:hypothetical protein OAY94_00895, partial [Prochlorococcus sp. AH-736-F17]|nr:hypothetical protein [Prochlorococcus sp. AH-736-F17]